MERLPQLVIGGKSSVDKRLVEAVDRTPIHLLMHAVAAVRATTDVSSPYASE